MANSHHAHWRPNLHVENEQADGRPSLHVENARGDGRPSLHIENAQADGQASLQVEWPQALSNRPKRPQFVFPASGRGLRNILWASLGAQGHSWDASGHARDRFLTAKLISQIIVFGLLDIK